MKLCCFQFFLKILPLIVEYQIVVFNFHSYKSHNFAFLTLVFEYQKVIFDYDSSRSQKSIFYCWYSNTKRWYSNTNSTRTKKQHLFCIILYIFVAYNSLNSRTKTNIIGMKVSDYNISKHPLASIEHNRSIIAHHHQNKA